MKPDFKFNFRRRRPPTSLLGLALDGSRLDGVVLKRTNGSLQLLQSFSVALTLDPLTAEAELVGREIRNQLDAAGVRERDCVLGLPLRWVLTAQTELPPLPPTDAASLLQIEAERGFPCDAATLQIADSRCPLADNKQHVLFAGIPSTQLVAMEKVLAAAKLKPASFTLGLTALSAPGGEKADGALALRIGESHVGLQVTAGGGVAALRALEGTVENEGGRRSLLAGVVARETRVTLGQLPAELRAAVKRIRIFGPPELARPLADEMELRFGPAGLAVEIVSGYAPGEFGVQLPAGAALSAAFSLAARALTEPQPVFEFLPPKPTLVEQFVAKYSSGRLRTAGAIGAVALGLAGLIFGYQQIQLWHLRSQWSAMAAKVADLEKVQDQIRQYRPWFGGTFPNLAIVRQLSLAFPEDGEVTMKNLEIRDGSTVTCSGTARDSAALLAMQGRLRTAAGVSDVKLEQIRGKAPMQFVFGFKFNQGGGSEN